MNRQVSQHIAAAVLSALPLLLGMFLLMVGNGLLSTLLTLRASELNFQPSLIGLVQSAYPLGFLLGCVLTPVLLREVGHVRVFAALASVASCATLGFLITGDALVWGLLRLLTGACFAGLYVVAESWLNAATTNATRGALLSVYFVIQTAGSGVGQAALTRFAALDDLPVLIVSILISLALVPMLLSASANPPYTPPARVSLAMLIRLSPMGISGCFINGITQGALFVALALYGTTVGLDTGAVGLLMTAMLFGGMLLQFPLGWLSDRIDRRWVMSGTAIVALTVASGLAVTAEAPAALSHLMWTIAVLGGMVLPMYSICVAHTNDHLRPEQVVGASSTLVLVLGAGNVMGPLLGSVAIDKLGPQGLFQVIALLQLLAVSTALLRLWHAGGVEPPYPASAVAMTQNATGHVARLNPSADED